MTKNSQMFAAILGVVACTWAALLIYVVTRPPPPTPEPYVVDDCREVVFRLSVPQALAMVTCPHPRQQVQEVDIVGHDQVLVCRCIDLQAVTTRTNTEISILDQRLLRIEHPKPGPSSSPVEQDVESLRWRLDRLERQVSP